MTTPPTDSTRSGEDGFSLIEALVVFAISALLMSVLTQLVLFTQASNEKLRVHFEEGADTRFLDVQVQALIDRLWVDPLYMSGEWQRSKTQSDAPSGRINLRRNSRSDLPVYGDADSITFSAYDPFDVDAKIMRFTLSLAARENREDGPQYLKLDSERYDVTWPARLPPEATLAYRTLEGVLSPIWPPERDARWTDDPFLSVLGPPPAPRSIHIIMPNDADGSLHVFDVRG